MQQPLLDKLNLLTQASDRYMLFVCVGLSLKSICCATRQKQSVSNVYNVDKKVDLVHTWLLVLRSHLLEEKHFVLDPRKAVLLAVTYLGNVTPVLHCPLIPRHLPWRSKVFCKSSQNAKLKCRLTAHSFDEWQLCSSRYKTLFILVSLAVVVDKYFHVLMTALMIQSRSQSRMKKKTQLQRALRILYDFYKSILFITLTISVVVNVYIYIIVYIAKI